MVAPLPELPDPLFFFSLTKKKHLSGAISLQIQVKPRRLFLIPFKALHRRPRSPSSRFALQGNSAPAGTSRLSSRCAPTGHHGARRGPRGGGRRHGIRLRVQEVKHRTLLLSG
ncbi:hypothetical protein PVAP13_9NG690614 [Panicum virgatum]|uniref:Uncharacterized protein n=1 Tax=Panicum virgatum TaxID=38727 RepID=A0A8T0N3K2_PANVG|nr:hypothetical protein PVAP13_9NG690614 [Panicum virgatum]